MEDKPYLSLSVHQLVDFLLREGDIDERIYNLETMQEGTRLHAIYQSKQKEGYLSEYQLSGNFETEEGTIILSGRADGIIVGGDYPVIDEIKSTVASLEGFYESQKSWHLGQAECYALMYINEKNLDKAGIRLTYISQVEDRRIVKEEVYSRALLEEKVYGYVRQYLSIYKRQFLHLKQRKLAAASLPFPFDGFRKGQKNLSKYVYSVASKGGVFFAEAPTGIGKTMSAIFPSVKSFASGKLDRVFYLTAKSTGKQAAKDALMKLRQKGYVGRESILQGKDKICFKKEASCNPDSCPFAKGYYGKLKSAVEEAISNENCFDEDYVSELARKYAMCPFELSLDLSLWSDVVVGDYNYFFDPFVYLDRFFGPQADASKSMLLIDEAHNLLDRARKMYSSEISSFSISKAKKSIKGKNMRGLSSSLNKLKDAMEEIEFEAGNEKLFVLNEPPLSLYRAIESLKRSTKKIQKEMKLSLTPEVDDLFLECHRYQKLLDEYYGSNCVIYFQREGKESKLCLSCLDPSSYLKASLTKVKGAFFFSATFSPISYYQNALLGKEDYPYLLLSSPFPKENFSLLIAPKVSTRYKDRKATAPEIAAYLKEFVSGRKGNYFFYFPSYEYLAMVEPFLDIEDADIHVQEKDMEEIDRKEFLLNFLPNPGKTTIGLMVLGGPFSEGIDLLDDRLIGVALVGIGLPMISKENDILKDYYQQKLGEGFDYAYKNPGMNKVMQAVGRLIRSESDIGTALLIDDRYLKDEYRNLFSRIWQEYEVVLSKEEVREEVSAFFERKKL